MNAAETLGVAPEAPLDVIKQAYYRLARKLHPDHGGLPADFARIRSAYESLLERRARAYLQPVRAEPRPTRGDTPTTILKVGKKTLANAAPQVAESIAETDERVAAGPIKWQAPVAEFERLVAQPRSIACESTDRAKRYRFGAGAHDTSFRRDRVSPSKPLPRHGGALGPVPISSMTAARVLGRVERVPPSTVGMFAMLSAAMLQGISLAAPRGSGLLQSLSIGTLILLPAAIASILGADGHFGSRKIFVGVAAAVFAALAIAAQLSSS